MSEEERHYEENYASSQFGSQTQGTLHYCSMASALLMVPGMLGSALYTVEVKALGMGSSLLNNDQCCPFWSLVTNVYRDIVLERDYICFLFLW